MRRLFVTIIALALAACGQGNDRANSADGVDSDRPLGKPIVVLAFGDSLFAGYNLPRSQAYPQQLEAALRNKGLNVRIQNAGVSGDTTAAGRARIGFVLDSMTVPPDLVMVELGANDMLRGLEPANARQNLDGIMAEIDRRGIDIAIVAMRAAPNLGSDYAAKFDSIYPDLAEKYDAALVPFFIEPLIRDRSLVQADQVHPTNEGVQAMVAGSVGHVVEAIEDL